MVRVAAEWRSTGPEGGANGDEAKGARCPVIPTDLLLWSPLFCVEIPTGGRNRTGKGSRAAGGGAPGWRPCPFGLVGAGSGVGVGRRGDYLRGKKKKGSKLCVPVPPKGSG